MIDAAMISDIEEIKQLKARYFYHLDHKEWDDWRESVSATTHPCMFRRRNWISSASTTSCPF